MAKENDITKTTNLEKAIFINDVILYNAKYNDNHPNIINESNIREQYLAYTERKDKITNSLKNNFCLHLNGFSMNNDELLYKGAADEITFLRKYSKEVHSTDLSDLMFNKNQPVLIPDNSDITVIVAAHGKKDENTNVLIFDNLDQKHKPQDIIKKIRETLELNIQDKDRNTSRDINVKFHSCYGLLITQNKDAMNELEKLSKSFPNSRVNLITEKFGAATYNTESFLNLNGDLYPTKVFLGDETHKGVFLIQEEIKQSKDRLIELLERLDKNTIKPGFTVDDFISNNQTNKYVKEYGKEYPNKAYNKYMKDLNDKIQGHLIHLGKDKEFIKELNNIQTQNLLMRFIRSLMRFIRSFKSEVNEINIYNIDKLIKYINKYEFDPEKEPYILESKAFMQKLEENQQKIENSRINLQDQSQVNAQDNRSLSSVIKYESMDSISNSQSIFKDQNKNSNSLFKVIDLIDKQDPKKINSNIKSNISKRSNSTPISKRSKYLSKPASNSSLVEKLKKEREERSKSQPNSKGRSL